jgi:UDP-glucose 4-epimerase
VKVLITGIAGATGRIVAMRLLEAGHQIIGIDKRSFPAAPEGLDMHRVDIRSRPAEDVFRTTAGGGAWRLSPRSHAARIATLNLGARAVFDHASLRREARRVVDVTPTTARAQIAALPHGRQPRRRCRASRARRSSPPICTPACPWRMPDMTTTVLRMVYTLGSTGQGTLASFIRRPRVPRILGFDPLFQFMHERDVASAIEAALKARIRGVYNVAGPPPVPLSTLIEETGRSSIALPEIAYRLALGRFGLPKLPAAALHHIKHPVIIDDRAFRNATGYTHKVSEGECMREYRNAFPIVELKRLPLPAVAPEAAAEDRRLSFECRASDADTRTAQVVSAAEHSCSPHRK